MKPLAEYKRKRDFYKTNEPKAQAVKRKAHRLIFVVQEHHASHLHYDFRLEWNGVLKSWAVPKGPSLDPTQKRLAVEVEDHPLEYAKFRGTIPEGQYGAGEVYRWDYGHWTPLDDPNTGLKKGHLEFSLQGHKLHGAFILVRTRASKGKPNWLLIKRHDEYAQEDGLASTRLEFVPPQLAQLVDSPPLGENWIHEIKYDGYRTQAHLDSGKVTLFTRTGLDWTKRYSRIAQDLKKAKVENAILDGEVVWQDAEGLSNFQLLQNALQSGHSQSLIYWTFDLLHLDGKDMRSLPQVARKDRLRKIIRSLKSPVIQYSDDTRGQGPEIFRASCAHHLEGIVSKQVDLPYVSGRHDAWVKTKCLQRQEFVIGGFSDPSGSRSSFGSLLLGVYQDSKLTYAGRCGTGFNQQTLRTLGQRLHSLEQEESPFAVRSPHGRDIHWVKPELVAEVAFASWTKDKVLRAPVFYGLRSDKPPEQIVMEKAKPKAEKKTKKAKLALSHPQKIVYVQEEITKEGVAHYYQTVSQWLLPHIADRPLSIIRCPNGSTKPCFFQKHIAYTDNIHEIPQGEGKQPFVCIDSLAGLMDLVQLGTLELHPWNCHQEKMENPDQIVMDFDPDVAVDFEEVKAGAIELRDILQQLGLKSFLKTTGGKGLHVQFPFEPLYSWDDVKNFARTLTLEMVSRHPKLYTSSLPKAKRKGKIFLDYLRNGRGATAVAPYSLRAREVSSVAMPIKWEHLRELTTSSFYTMEKTLAHLQKRKSDPWSGYLKLRQKISLLKT